jgi:hypothetical protein
LRNQQPPFIIPTCIGGDFYMPESDEIHVPRPWVQVAAICHTALIENTGQLSVIRITDRIAVAGVTPEMQPQPLQLTMAILLKSGDMHGQYNVRVRCTSPQGQETLGQEILFLFEGGDRGVQTIVPIAMVATEPGTYWFDVMLEEDVLTRVPLTVLYQKIQLPPGMHPGLGPSGIGT